MPVTSIARHTNWQGHTIYSPYSVVQVVENVVEVRPVDKPHSTTTFVALKWVRICPEEMSNEVYNGNGRLSLVI